MKKAVSSAPAQRLGSLELGRLIAASLVVISHLVSLDAAPGPLGVQYFFVLSGFVMISAHHGDFGRWRGPLTFWWRRVCRIYPLYWLMLLPVMFYYYHGLAPAGTNWALFSLTPRVVNDLIPPAWTLRFEVAFYIMFGLCLLPHVGRVILAGWVLSVLWLLVPIPVFRFFHIHRYNIMFLRAVGLNNHFISVFELYFFAGLLGGWLLLKSRPSIILALAGLLIGGALMFIKLKVTQWGYVYPRPLDLAVLSLGYAGVMFGFAMLERCGIFRLGKWAAWAGAISYPLYISHSLPLLAADKLLPAPLRANILVEGVLLLLIYAVAIWLAFNVDRPLQRMLRRGAKNA